jgi:hypothetical protein
MAASIPIRLTITQNACASGVPTTAVSYSAVAATSVTVEGVITIGEEAIYTIIVAFSPPEISWITSLLYIGPACAGVDTFTFVTTGAISDLNSLEALTTVIPNTATVKTTTPEPTSSATSTETGSPIVSQAFPSKGLAGGPVAGVAVGCFLAGALLTLFAVVCLGRRWQRAHRLQPATAAAATTEGEVKRKPKRKPVLGPPQDPPMRPVGLDDGPVVGYVGAAVGVGEGEDLPEARVR